MLKALIKGASDAAAMADPTKGRLKAKHEVLIALLDPIPGIDRRTAEAILAEIGPDVSCLPRRMPRKKAITALAHRLLVIIYHVIRTREPYQDLGVTYHDQRDRQQIVRRALRQTGDHLAEADIRFFLRQKGVLEAFRYFRGRRTDKRGAKTYGRVYRLGHPIRSAE